MNNNENPNSGGEEARPRVGWVSKMGRIERLLIATLGLLLFHGLCTIPVYGGSAILGALGYLPMLLLPVLLIPLVPVALLIATIVTARNLRQLGYRQLVIRLTLIGLLVGFSWWSAIRPWQTGAPMSAPFADLGLRMRYGSKIDRLQAWAESYLQAHDGALDSRSVELLGIPKDLAISNVVYASGTTSNDRHLTFVWGGGFGHWGLLIGPKTYRTKTNGGCYKWRDGVYSFNGT